VIVRLCYKLPKNFVNAYNPAAQIRHRSKMPVEIDAELVTYLQPGPFSAIVANCNSQLVPETVRAWGQSVTEDLQAIDLCVGRQAARRLIENFQQTTAVSLAIVNVTTYQAIQLKGRLLEVGDPSAEDRIRVRQHGDAFVAGVARVGVSEAAARGTLVSDVIRIRFVPELLFDQTPGPQAGTQR
jgi:hypothetical protein